MTTNACRSNATATYSDIDWTLSGAALQNPVTLGTDPTVTLSGASIQGFIPADLLVAGYNLGLLQQGVNNVPTELTVLRAATNVDSDGDALTTGDAGTYYQADTVSFIATTEITDDGTTVTATPIEVNQPLPDMVVIPTGGNIEFRQADPAEQSLAPQTDIKGNAVDPAGTIFTSSDAGLPNGVNFDCSPGMSLDANGDTENETYTPASSVAPFETVVVNAPPTAPVCQNESTSVGVTQTIQINLNDNCTDVNEDQGGGSPYTFTVDTTGLAGTLVATATNGVYEYTAPANDPGAPTTFTFTATDSSPEALTSNTATVSITILANQCDATTAECSLTQIVVQPVVGTTMTMDKVAGNVIMSPVVLNGDAQVSNGALNQITVTNARGTAAGWAVTAYATDLGAPGSPTIEPIPGVVIAACSVEGSLGLQPNHDRLCIPGNNLAWTPSAAIAHDVIYGDVAQVDPGAALATDAADWRTQLVAAGNANAGGLGGLQAENVLCSAPDNQSGGTFTCDASLYLGVPASAGAGNYAGGLVLTLL